jgi:hypothetical protein
MREEPYKGADMDQRLRLRERNVGVHYPETDSSRGHRQPDAVHYDARNGTYTNVFRGANVRQHGPVRESAAEPEDILSLLAQRGE